MGTSKFYLAVGFIVMMAAPLDFTKDTGPTAANTTATTTTKNEQNINEVTSKSADQNSTSNTDASTQSTNNSPLTKSDKFTVSPNTPESPILKMLAEKAALMGGGAVLFGLLISNIVLACCIYSLRRRMSYWAITRIGNLTDVTEDRYVVGDAGLPADQAVELSTIYTMPDKTAQEGNAKEAHKAEGATTSEADPANGDAQSPEQAEALPPEPPADVAEPADDVTDVLLVV